MVSSHLNIFNLIIIALHFVCSTIKVFVFFQMTCLKVIMMKVNRHLKSEKSVDTHRQQLFQDIVTIIVAITVAALSTTAVNKRCVN